ncbi:MAG: 50S ribosomal protein L29 [Rhodobacteraceae bacterium]|nr:50S ribosomal protein L29 [Paracoccaceae bacterium]
MDTRQLREKTPDELRNMHLELKKEAFNIRFRLVEGNFQNTARIKEVRRDIARINTILNEQKEKV